MVPVTIHLQFSNLKENIKLSMTFNNSYLIPVKLNLIRLRFYVKMLLVIKCLIRCLIFESLEGDPSYL